jgi:hypothetical protein
MEWIALIVALAALVVFLATHFGVQRSWATLSLGLALLTTALIVWHVVAGLDAIITVSD